MIEKFRDQIQEIGSQLFEIIPITRANNRKRRNQKRKFIKKP
jgi:hypothetical protein